MIVLNKDLKIRLLKAIKAGKFDGSQFPELAGELKLVTVEIINHPDMVRHNNDENTDNERAED